MSPQSKAQLARARALKREHLIGAALAVFAEHGFAGSTTKRLAEAAGVSEGLFYHYFPSKQALLSALRDRVMTDVRATIAAHRAEPGARAEKLVRAVLESFRTHQQFWRLALFDRSHAAVRETLEAETQKLSLEFQRALKNALRKEGAHVPEIEAELLFATFEGVTERFIRNPDNYPFDAVVDQLVATLLERKH